MKPKLVAGIAIVAVVGAAGGGWALGRNVESPAQAASKAKAPKASRITVPVEYTELSSTLIVRGTVRYGEPVDVSLAPSSGGAAKFVTIAPIQGAEVKEGSMAMEVSSRPVFAIQGEFPMYRDLKLGSHGDDVRQVEEGLKRLGFDPGVIDGVFDDATAAAVDAMYKAGGHDARGASEEQRKALRGARTAVEAADERVRQARKELAKVLEGPDATAIDEADSALKSAQDQAAAARTESTKSDTMAANDVTNKTAMRNNAKAKLDADVAASAPADMIAGDQLALTQSQQDLDLAVAAVPTIHAAGLAAIRQADDGVKLAQKRLDAARKPLDTYSAKQSLADAEKGATSAREDLADASKGVGLYIPADELVFFPKLPVRVDVVKVVRGSALSGAVMTVSNSRLAVDSAVSLGDRKLVREKMTVEIEDSNLGIKVAGTIKSIAEKPNTNNVGDQRVYMEITPEKVPPEMVGGSVKITIPIQATTGKSLAVPAAALSVDGQGRSRVEVEDDATKPTRFVLVTPGLSADGLVAISVVSGGALKEGDQVVVGAKPLDSTGTLPVESSVPNSAVPSSAVPASAGGNAATTTSLAP